MTRKVSPSDLFRSPPKEELITERLFEEAPADTRKSRRSGVIIDVDPVVIESTAPAEKSQPLDATHQEFTVTVEPEPVEISPPPATPPEPKRSEPKAQDKAPPRVAKPKPPKAPRAPRAKRAAPAVCLIVETRGSRPHYFSLGSNGLQLLDSLPRRARLLSISAADARIASEDSLSSRQAQQLAAEALFEPAYSINGTKTHGAVYATAQSRADELAGSLHSGIAILDSLRHRRDPGEGASVFGWRLKDAHGKDAIVALYHRSASGFVSSPLVSVYPAETEELISQFRAAQQARDSAQVLFFDQQDLLTAGIESAQYPHKPLFGVTLKHLAWVGLLIASTVFAVQSGRMVQTAWLTLDLQKGQIAAQEARLHAALPSGAR